MILSIDLDGTVCTEEKTFERALAQPIPGARDALQSLVDAGHTVVIYSARSWSELRMTEAWLKTHRIPYHGLHLGKPVADLFIDDRGVGFKDWATTMSEVERRISARNKPSTENRPTAREPE